MNKRRKVKKNIQLGYYYLWFNNLDVAIYFFEYSITIQKGFQIINEDIYYFIAEYYLEKGNKDKALKYSSLGANIYNHKNKLGIKKEKQKNLKK